MNPNEIIEMLKTTYSREVRKGLIKTILEKEKESDKLATLQQYKLINQIFSYVLGQSGWKMGEDSTVWDAQPLKIMTEVFPKLSTTNWYSEQLLKTKQKVEVKVQEK
jgi:hypothetical protein